MCTDKQLPVLPVFRENSVVDVSSCASVHHVSSERNENRQKTVVRAAKTTMFFFLKKRKKKKKILTMGFYISYTFLIVQLTSFTVRTFLI